MLQLVVSVAIGLPFVWQETETLREELPGGGVVERQVLAGGTGEPVNHGTYTRSSPAGVVLEEGLYEQGRREGRWRWRYEDKKLRATGTYIRGRRTDKWTFHYPRKGKRAQGTYRRGVQRGDWNYWDADGSLNERESGSYVAETRSYASGEMRATGLLVDGAPTGRWRYLWPSGVLQLEADFKRGSRAGTWRFSHPDGTYDAGFVSGTYGDRSSCARIEEEMTFLEGGAAGVAGPEGHTEEAVSVLLEESRAGEWSLRPGVDKLLEELCSLDLATESGSNRGREIQQELSEHCAGRSFGWVNGVDPDSVAYNELAALRWRSFFLLTGQRREFWELDMTLRDSTRNRPVPPPELLELRLDDELVEPPGRASILFPGRFDPRIRRESLRDGHPLQLALKWLVWHQSDDGRWASANFRDNCGRVGEGACDGPGEQIHDVGVTGLALLALLGDGSTTNSGPYEKPVVRGVRWLIDQQDPRTGLIGRKLGHHFLYRHGIATQALCEASISSDSALLRRACESAVAYILAARNPGSAWRYEVPPKDDNDTSMTGWMVLALLSAEKAGIPVDKDAYAGALAWIDGVTDEASGRVGYDTKGTSSSRVTGINEHFDPTKGEAMTAVGLLCRLLLGQDARDQRILGKHAALIRRHLPEWDPGVGCDMYYWYYGSYAMYQMGGSAWTAWAKSMKKVLSASQREREDLRGSWDPVGPWGYSGGRVYSTALMALCLETEFRYPAPAR